MIGVPGDLNRIDKICSSKKFMSLLWQVMFSNSFTTGYLKTHAAYAVRSFLVSRV